MSKKMNDNLPHVESLKNKKDQLENLHGTKNNDNTSEAMQASFQQTLVKLKVELEKNVKLVEQIINGRFVKGGDELNAQPGLEKQASRLDEPLKTAYGVNMQNKAQQQAAQKPVQKSGEPVVRSGNNGTSSGPRRGGPG